MESTSKPADIVSSQPQTISGFVSAHTEVAAISLFFLFSCIAVIFYLIARNDEPSAKIINRVKKSLETTSLVFIPIITLFIGLLQINIAKNQNDISQKQADLMKEQNKISDMMYQPMFDISVIDGDKTRFVVSGDEVRYQLKEIQAYLVYEVHFNRSLNRKENNILMVTMQDGRTSSTSRNEGVKKTSEVVLGQYTNKKHDEIIKFLTEEQKVQYDVAGLIGRYYIVVFYRDVRGIDKVKVFVYTVFFGPPREMTIEEAQKIAGVLEPDSWQFIGNDQILHMRISGLFDDDRNKREYYRRK